MTDYYSKAVEYFKHKIDEDDIDILKYCAKKDIERDKSLKKLFTIMDNNEEIYSDKEQNEAAKALYEVTSKGGGDKNEINGLIANGIQSE